jgi:hypothetical protein
MALSGVKIDMPVDEAHKLSRFLYKKSKNWDGLAGAIEDAATLAGDGVTITVSFE